MNHTFLQDALIYLAAAIVFVPVAKRLGMGSVLGYLLAGITIGPFFLGLVGGEGQEIIHFAEFGVVLMLFLIGLELEPAHFWGMRHLILGSGAVQLCATTLLFLALFMVIGLQLAGGPGHRAGPRHVVDGDRPADPAGERAGPDAIGKKLLRRPFVSGHIGHSHPGGAAASGHRHGTDRGGRHRPRSWGGCPGGRRRSPCLAPSGP